jgi:F0F1-type ATP synthase membrane subunit b/b'
MNDDELSLEEQPLVPATDVEELILRVREQIEIARSMPMSASVLVNREELLAMLDETLQAMPEELRHARWLLKEREEFLEEARRDAQDIRDQAAATAARMVEEREIVRQADATARQIVHDAEAAARQIQHEAEDYIDQKLAAFEVVLDRTMQTVQKGRERLQVIVEPEPAAEMAEVVELADVHGEAGGAFFDQDLD